MRLIQVTIPTGKREAILAVLDDEGIDYVVSEETSGRDHTAIAYLPVPTNAVEPVLDRLREVGMDQGGYTVVLDANTVISRRFEDLQKRYAEDESEDRIAREELVTAVRSLAPRQSIYVVMTITSALIATAGLLLDSPAVVVGSMVIAPLIGPAMATSVGTVTDDANLFRRGVFLQALGLTVAVVSAAAFAFLVQGLHLVPPIADVTTVGQIRERVSPDFLSLVVALGAGVAGVLSLTSGFSTAIVGVMIAVALIPPAATVGIGVAWGQPMVVLGSSILLLVNVLSINLAALCVLWYFGYRPRRWLRTDEARRETLKRVATLVIAIVVLSTFLGGVTLDSFQRAQTEEELREHANATVDDAGGTLIEMDVEYRNTAVFRHPTRMVVSVGLPPNVTRPSLIGDLDRMADAVTGRDVATQVRYVTVEST